MEDGIAALAGGVFSLFYLAIIVVLIAAQWKIFAKAGKPGWACIVPIYSTIVLLEIVGKPLWWIFEAIGTFAAKLTIWAKSVRFQCV